MTQKLRVHWNLNNDWRGANSNYILLHQFPDSSVSTEESLLTPFILCIVTKEASLDLESQVSVSMIYLVTRYRQTTVDTDQREKVEGEYSCRKTFYIRNKVVFILLRFEDQNTAWPRTYFVPNNLQAFRSDVRPSFDEGDG